MLLLVSCISYSQTTIPGGTVSGTWTAANSPYIIHGEITIHSDSSLTIEPGVEVIFNGHYKFNMEGIISAVGTEQDSILFTAANPDTGWRGLRFTNAPDGSQLSYCVLEYGRATIGTHFLDRRGGGIYSNTSRPEISHCTIKDCFADFAGGGIYVFAGVTVAYPSVSNCTIMRNSSNGMGGGIYSTVSSFAISDCNISSNWSTYDGGGLYLSFSATDSVNILNCTISNNSVGDDGGGIYATGGTLTISGCHITGNTANSTGGIRITNAATTIANSTICGNNANNTSGAIFFDNSQGVIDNCIINDNQTDGSLTLNFSSAVISGCSMTGMDPTILYYSSAHFSYCTFNDNTGTTAGGIYIINESQAEIDHCNFTNNSASTGSAIKIYSGSSADISNSIFAWNSSSAIQCYGTGTIIYSDFYRNGQNVAGNIPSDFGVLNTINANEDSCDQYFNIFMDPMFVDTTSGDYHLQAGSPCIDAGNPASPYDPDGTITNMGRYFFDQGGTGIFGGFISGNWTAAGSPYRIVGDITIHADSALTIDPGVNVIFQGHYQFNVNGIIHAVGTDQDSILFDALNHNTGWGGMRFTYTPDGSELSYCILKHGRATPGSGGGINIYSSSPQINHCTIIYNSATNDGGGVFWSGGTVDIRDCILSNNSAGHEGGGLFFRGSATDSVHFSNCSLNDNSSGQGGGGGIFVRNSHVFISGCTVTNNSSLGAGGGLYIAEFLYMINSRLQGNVSGGGLEEYETGGGGLIAFNDILVDNCNISNNVSHDGFWPSRGGGINCTIGIDSVTITNSTIMNNTASIGGGISSLDRGSVLTMAYCKILNNNAGGVYSEAHDTNIDHCSISGNALGSGGFYIYRSSVISNSIFSWNSPAAIYYTNLPSNRTLAYSDFFGNNQDITGTIPSGFGLLDTTNTNNDSCDVYSNIFLDPLFADTASLDFHLTANSPCIDAGDPSSPLDPDSTFTDMGAYYFDQFFPVIYVNLDSLEFGEVEIGAQKDTTFKIFNQGTDTLLINQINSNTSVFTTNFNPANNFILPNDSMLITVTFTPTDSGFVDDTLVIDNNAQMINMYLSGKGKTPVGLVDDELNIPKKYALYPAYPNPFNPTTTIKFDLPKMSIVELKIFDILGKQVAKLISEQKTAGRYSYILKGINLASGLYFVQFQADDFQAMQKILLIK